MSVLDVVRVSKARLRSASFILFVINGLTLIVPDAMRFRAFLKWVGVVWKAPRMVVSP